MKQPLVVLFVASFAATGLQAQSIAIKPSPFQPIALQSFSKKFSFGFKAKDLAATAVKAALPEPVKLRSELETLFSDNGCSISKELRAKIKKAAKDEGGPESEVPRELQILLGQSTLDAPLQAYPGSTANSVLHAITIPETDAIPISTDSKKITLSLSGAETYNQKTAADFIDGQDEDIAYTSDCSAYVTAAVRAGISTGINLQSEAKAAAADNKSLLVMRGHVFSPAVAAIDPNVGGTSLNTRQRTDLLYAIVAEITGNYKTRSKKLPPDHLPVTSWRKLDVVWTSNRGDASLSGQASVTGNAAAGLGVVSITSSIGSGAQLSKQVKFSSFNTYILNDQDLEGVTREFGDIKRRLKSQIQKARAEVKLVDKEYRATFADIPEKACNLDWTSTVQGTASAGLAYTTWSTDKGCEVEFRPDVGFAPGSIVNLNASEFGIEFFMAFLSPS